MNDGTHTAAPGQAERVSAEFWATLDVTGEVATVDHRPPPTTFEAYLKIYGRPLGGATRTRPRELDKRRIRVRQGNVCLYCGQPIGSLVLRNGRVIELRPNWDHFVPYVYAQRNDFDNWVLACHLCNLIKHSKIFETVVEAQQFIRARWHEKGIELMDMDLQARIRAGEL